MTAVASTSNSSQTSGLVNGQGTINNQSDYNTAYTNFLSLLTTELKNQDPTSPMDTNQFTNQLVGFSQLEQQLQSNSKLDSLVSNTANTGLGNALGYLGHKVTVPGSNFTLDGSTPASFSYSLASTADTATLNVTDSSGAVVRSLAVPTGAGAHALSFDGTADGQAALPAGTYGFSVSATDAKGNSVAATNSVTGTVTGVDTSGGATRLTVAGAEYDPATVTAISN